MIKKTRTLVVFTLLSTATSCVLHTREDLHGKLNQVPPVNPPHQNTPLTQQKTPQKDSTQRMERWDRLNELETQIQSLRSEVEILQNQLSSQTFRDQQPVKHKSKKAYEEALFNFEKSLKKLQRRIEKLESSKKQGRLSKKFKKVSKAKTKKTKKPRNTLLTKAEQAFRKKSWARSIQLFEDYRKTIKKGRSYRKATYKMAVAFQQLGLKKEARSFLEELVKKHPQSLEAKAAQKKLDELF